MLRTESTDILNFNFAAPVFRPRFIFYEYDQFYVLASRFLSVEREK